MRAWRSTQAERNWACACGELLVPSVRNSPGTYCPAATLG